MLTKIVIIKEKNRFFQKQKESLFFSFWFLPKNLFCKSFFIIQYMLNDKINTIILIKIYIIRFGFITEKFAKIVCKKLEI